MRAAVTGGGWKAAAKAAPTAAERHRLEVAQYGLKIVLNSTFGKFGSRYSTLFDLEAMLGVTLSGQLLLIDLVERLEDAAARFSARTPMVCSSAHGGVTIGGDRSWRTGSATPRWCWKLTPSTACSCSGRTATPPGTRRAGSSARGGPQGGPRSREGVERAGRRGRGGGGAARRRAARGDHRLGAAVGALLLRDPDVGQVREAVVVDAAAGTETPLPKIALVQGRRARRSGSSIGSPRARPRRRRRPPASAWRSPSATARSRATSTWPITSPRPARSSTPSPGDTASTPPCSRPAASPGRSSSGAWSPSPRT